MTQAATPTRQQTTWPAVQRTVPGQQGVDLVDVQAVVRAEQAVQATRQAAMAQEPTPRVWAAQRQRQARRGHAPGKGVRAAAGRTPWS
jgi:hypothetical protein